MAEHLVTLKEIKPLYYSVNEILDHSIAQRKTKLPMYDRIILLTRKVQEYKRPDECSSLIK